MFCYHCDGELGRRGGEQARRGGEQLVLVQVARLFLEVVMMGVE